MMADPKRKILMVALDFPPCQSAGVQRTLKFCDYLVDYDWQPLILSAQKHIYQNFDRDLLVPDSVDPFVYRAFGLNAYKHLSLKGKYFRFTELPDRYASWYWHARIVGKQMLEEHKPEVLWSTFPCPTAHKIASYLKQQSGLPWVADFRDPYGGHYALEKGFSYPSNMPAQKIDADVVKNADLLIFTTEHAADLYRRAYNLGDDSRVSVIENGFNEDLFAGFNASLIKQERSTNFTVLHSGELYGGRNPQFLFDALESLATTNQSFAEQLKIVFRGASDVEDYSQLVASKNLTESVAFAPKLSYSESISEMMAADCLILFQSSNFHNQIPGKVYEYLRACKPILALTNQGSATARLLEDIPHAVVADMESSEQITNGLLQVSQLSVEENFDFEVYNRRTRTKVLAEKLEKLVGQKKLENLAPRTSVDEFSNIRPSNVGSAPTYRHEGFESIEVSPSSSPQLIVVVDTEEEFDWSAPPDPKSNSVSAIKYIDRVQNIFDEYGIKPCYVVDYSVASQTQAADVIKDIYNDERCEFGAHLHPWVNPPFDEENNEFNTFPGNLTKDLEYAKLRCLSETLEQVFGSYPKIYKAGRYGLGENTYEILESLGFNIDLSVCSKMDFSSMGGPDYRQFKPKPFRFGSDCNSLGIPTSGAFVGWSGQLASHLHSFAHQLEWSRLPAVLARTRAVDRLMLSPEGYTAEEHQLLVKHLLNTGVRNFTWSFHSPSVVPGFSPYVSSESELRQFLDSFRRFFDFFFGEMNGVSITPTQLYDQLIVENKK